MTKDKSNVKAIRPSIKISSEDDVIQPDTEVVECLKHLLSLAEKGELQHLVFVGVGKEGTPHIDKGIVGDFHNVHYVLSTLQAQLIQYTDAFQYIMDGIAEEFIFDE